MIAAAAVYARKSTDQNLPDEEKSITRQVDRARAYAARKGWIVAAADSSTQCLATAAGAVSERDAGRTIERVEVRRMAWA